jgi:hypothetical protein
LGGTYTPSRHCGHCEKKFAQVSKQPDCCSWAQSSDSKDTVGKGEGGRERGDGGRGTGAGGLRTEPRYLLLKLIGQEQELALSEPPDIELAEILELTIDLLLTGPRPPPNSEDEDRRPDAGIVWARKILQNMKNKRDFSQFLLMSHTI